MAWDKMCIMKKNGGLGFRNLFAFNLAMLGKQAWKIMYMPKVFPSRVFRAKYFFPKGNFMGATLGHKPSFTW